MEYLLILVAVAVLLIGLALLVPVLRGQSELVGQVRQLNDASTRAQAELTRGLNERLDAVADRVGQGIEQSATKTGKAVADIAVRLALIDEAQKGLALLSNQVTGLHALFDNKQARGAWGEVQLENLVRDVLPAAAYEFQASLGNGRRVDCLIRLPNPPGPIAIDAKFPLESYRALRGAADDPARMQAMRAFTSAMQKHIDDIAERYIVPGETADSAILFLPSEAVYAELDANFTNVVETARRRRVWIVSPNTMWATLTTVRSVLRDVRMREQAGEVQKQVGLLVKDVRLLGERAGKLKTHLGQAENDLKEIDISAGRIAKRAEQIEEVQLEDAAAVVSLTPPLKAVSGE